MRKWSDQVAASLAAKTVPDSIGEAAITILSFSANHLFLQ